MTDGRQADQLEKLIPEPFVAPQYGGRSVANVPATIGALLDAGVGTLPALDGDCWRDLRHGGVDRVVLLLADAVGWHRLRRSLARDEPSARWLEARGGVSQAITSIFPSTTSTTLITLWTGEPPTVHGITGYTVWMRELGIVVNTISFKPASKVLRGNLQEALGERAAPPLPTLPEQLAASGIETHMLMPAQVVKSGLTAIQARGARSVTGFVGLGDCVTAMRQALEASAGRRALLAVYWPTFDDLSHLRGPDPEHWDAELRLLLGALRDELIDPLGAAARNRTVMALTADHGQVALDPRRFVSLADHPALADCLIIPPTGDPRAPYLHVRDGQRMPARRYVEDQLGGLFAVLDGDEALAAGLWGPGPAAPGIRSRLGDLVLLAYEGSALVPPSGELKMLGTHGSLLREEAEVPWLAWRLDG